MKQSLWDFSYQLKEINHDIDRACMFGSLELTNQLLEVKYKYQDALRKLKTEEKKPFASFDKQEF